MAKHLLYFQEVVVDNNLSVNEIMENESLFHDTTRHIFRNSVYYRFSSMQESSEITTE